MEMNRGGAARHFHLALSLLLAVLVVIFAVQNAAVVEVRFLVWSFLMSLSLFVFLLFILGIVTGWLMHSYSIHRRVSASRGKGAG